ncbi:OB-fold domain-containing protein [Thermodesulfobacteriota bacterium]
MENSIGIVSFGVYLPAYRLSRKVIAAATGGYPRRGEKAVANYDEDALTMGVNASLECLDNYFRSWDTAVDHSKLGALLFTSTSSPYLEKQAASVIGDVLEVNPSALITDLNGSLRGALTAIEIGKTFLTQNNDMRQAVIVASDRRPAEPGSAEEQAFGDGAAALLLGRGDTMAQIEASHATNANFTHFWRRESDPFVQSGDQRFVNNLGYTPLMSKVIGDLIKKVDLSAENISKLVAYAPNPRLLNGLAKKLGFNAETQIAETLSGSIGDSGTAQVLISLINVLSKAQPGDNIIVAGYGDGAEALFLKVTENIERAKKCRPVKAHLERKRSLNSYAKYLNFRDITAESSYDAFTSLPLLWRESKQNMRLYAVKCRACQAIHFPQRRVCHSCGTKDQMDPFKLNRRGKIYTYTNDYLYLNPDPPGSLAAIDLDEGGRFFGQMTDTDPQEIKIGMAVELSFRKLHDGQNFPNYFWKAVKAMGRE